MNFTSFSSPVDPPTTHDAFADGIGALIGAIFAANLPGTKADPVT